MTRPGPTDWRVHLGAHKTASTHLAKMLLRRRDRLAEQGVTYVSQARVIRPLFGRQGRSLPEKLLTRLTPRAAQVFRPLRGRAIRREILSHVAQPGAVLFSEENLLGPLKSCLGGRMYPDLSQLHLLRRVIGPDRAHLFLAIRSFDGYLPSLYCQELKLSRMDRPVLDRAVARFLETPPRWIDLIRRIRTILPEAQLQVWDYADYRPNDWRIAEAVAGVDLGPTETETIRTRTTSPSAEAVAAAEALDLPTGRERSKRVREMFAQDIERGGGTRFDPLPAEVKQAFRDAFHRDLEEIERAFPGMRMRFDP